MPYPQPSYIDQLQGAQNPSYRQLFLMADANPNLTIKGHICFAYGGYHWGVFRNQTQSPSSVDFTVYRTAVLSSSEAPQWVEQDYTNRPTNVFTSSDPRWGAQAVGDRIYIFVQHSAGSGKLGVRIYRFDMSTDSWISGYLSGLDDTAASFWTSVFFSDLVVRGTDIIVFHRKPSEVFATPYNAYYSVFDTTTAGYSSTFNAVDVSGNAMVSGRALVHADGRISFFYLETGALPPRAWHKILNGGTWGPAQELIGLISTSTYNKNAFFSNLTFARPQEWNGTISFAASAWHNSGTQSDILRFHAPNGDNNPTWSAEVVASHAQSALTDYRVPFEMVVHGGTLTIVYGYDYDGFARLMYQSNSGSGWSAADAVLYDYESNPPQYPRPVSGLRIANVDFVVTDCPLFGGIQMIAELASDTFYLQTLQAYAVGCEVCCMCDEAY